MDIKVPRFEANEIAKDIDFDYINDREYANLCTIFEELFGRLVNDIIVGGLNCQQRSTPSMNVDLSIGLGYCKSTGKVAHTGSLFGPIAVTNGGAQTRIDLVEIRLKETDYDSQQRAFKDPVTGYISYQDINTKTRFEIEAQVIQGTEGAGVAQSHTTGWVKIAEVTVDAGETTSILDADIENCTGGYDTETTTNWTAETAVTFRLGSVENFKAKFRVKHKENGDHENNIIKDQHIDFGTGANQVNAIDIPIVDAGGRITATEVENALQELAGSGRTSETIKSAYDLGDAAIVDSADTVKDSHIDWGSGASQVDLDDVPESSTKKHLTTAAQTIAGNKTFSGNIIDKNGNEVIAMLMETKQNTSGGTLVASGTTDVVVSGFSFTPDAILVAQVNTDNILYKSFGYGTGFVARTDLANAGRVNLEQLIIGANQVTVKIRNDETATRTWRSVIVTAVKTS